MDQKDEHGLAHWPAPERNKQAILDELLQILPVSGGLLLEIAAATGQHALHFARALPHYRYQTSDYDPEHLATLEGRQKTAGLPNLRSPLRLDVTDEEWPLRSADVVYNANMVHIAPFAVAEGLFLGAGRLLSAGGHLITYGPYRLEGVEIAESNERFDASLKSRDPSWGIRRLSDLRELGEKNGFSVREPRAMPANNHLLVWDKI